MLLFYEQLSLIDLPLIQDIFIDRWLKLEYGILIEVGSNESDVFAC